MENIYKGYKFAMVVSSSVEVDIPTSYLYHPLTDSRISLGTPVFKGKDEDGNFLYQVLISDDHTRKMPTGTYDLYLTTPERFVAGEYVKNFARAIIGPLTNVDEIELS